MFLSDFDIFLYFHVLLHVNRISNLLCHTFLQMENNYRDNSSIVDQKQNDIFIHLLPVIICMSVIGAVGIFGNILTFIFYAFKCKHSTQNVQIACLAFVDFIVCLMIAHVMYLFYMNVNYTNRYLCKLSYFVVWWAIACSCLMICLIAIDRHRKVCKPFSKQITKSLNAFIIVGIAIFSLLMSIRNLVYFDSVEISIPIPNSNEYVTGYVCTTMPQSEYKLAVKVFYGIDISIVTIILATVAVTYTCVLCKIARLKNILSHDKNNENIDNVGHRNLKQTLTYQMFTVSLVFVLCFAPYFAIRITLLHGLSSLEKVELASGKQFALRIVYLHSAFNPIIYCCFNLRLRQYIKQLFLRMWYCGQKSNI
jgi:hypothetical protein